MANKNWWRTNIQDPIHYVRTLRQYLAEPPAEELTAERLKAAIEEDSREPISVEECQKLLDEEARITKRE